MFDAFFKMLYTKVLINIIIDDTDTTVYVEILSGKKVKSSTTRTFETVTLSSHLRLFVDEFSKESPYCYISVLDGFVEQGAIPTCTYSQMQDFCDIKNSRYLCFDNKWAFYTSDYNIEEIQKTYKEIGVDYIFSPFAILVNFFKDKINLPATMYVLIRKNSASLAVFDNAKLLFAKQIDLKDTKNDELLIDVSIDENQDENLFDIGSIEIEDLNFDEEKLDDLSDLEDLDVGAGFDNFSQNNTEKEKDEDDKKDELKAMDSKFEDGYKIFTSIQNALNTFYKNSNYDSVFVESIYIADSTGETGDLKNYLEDEMFLNVYSRRIDLSMSLCDLAKAEK